MQKDPAIPPSVIIFDDEEDILIVCATVLQARGWKVTTYTDVIDIPEKVLNIMPSVIIMDNHIPEHGGIKATQLLKAHEKLKHIPVIFITANLHIESLAATAGAEYWMSKPFSVEQLEASVNKATAVC